MAPRDLVAHVLHGVVERTLEHEANDDAGDALEAVGVELVDASDGVDRFLDGLETSDSTSAGEPPRKIVVIVTMGISILGMSPRPGCEGESAREPASSRVTMVPARAGE